MRLTNHKASEVNHCRQNLLSVLLVLLLPSCASTPPPEPDPSIIATLPQDWGVNIDVANVECRPINQAFENLGIRNAQNGVRTQDGLLSRDILNRSLSARVVAESVALVSITQANVLNAELRGEFNMTIAIEISCRSGWHMFEFRRSGQFLGDGVVEKQFLQRAWFRQDRDGNLVARVIKNAEYVIRFTDINRQSTDEWFLFSPLR